MIPSLQQLNSEDVLLQQRVQNVQLAKNLARKMESEGPDRLRKTAQEFEALFINMMLQSMRNTVPDGSLFKENSGDRIYRGMLDQEIATTMSQSTRFGLTNMIVRAIERLQNPDDSIRIQRQFLPLQPKTPAGVPLRDGVDRPSKQTAAPPDLDALSLHAGRKYQLDPLLIKSVILSESAGDPGAVSPMGAKGLMQLMDSTARDLGVANVFDPQENVEGGARYLKQLLGQFSGKVPLALAAYNAGPGRVREYGGIPPFPETQQYVAKVMSMREKLHQRRAELQASRAQVDM